MFEQELQEVLERLAREGANYLTGSSRTGTALPPERFRTPFYPPESHEIHTEMIHLVSGRPAVHVNGRWSELESRRLQVFLPGTVHTEHWLEEDIPYVIFWMNAAPEGLNIYHTTYTPGSGYGQSGVRVHLTSPFAHDLWACSTEKKIDLPRFHFLLMSSVDFALRNGGTDTINYHRGAALQVRNCIDRTFQRPITLRDLGSLVNYAPPHLNRLFRAQFGISIHRYLCNVRLEHAARLLRSGTVLVRDAAADSGIPDQRYFCRAFRRKFGVPPGEYASRKPS